MKTPQKSRFVLCREAAKLARRVYNPLTDHLPTTIKQAAEACDGKRAVRDINQTLPQREYRINLCAGMRTTHPR